MEGRSGEDARRAVRPLQDVPVVASGRALVLSALLLVVGDTVGGLLAVASGVESWNEAWGFETQSTVPLPMGLAQLALAWLAARNVRPPVGRIAAILLTAICLMSVIFGLFDGDLIGKVGSEGVSLGVVWVFVVLLPLTAAVGVLAALRSKQLRRPR